MNAGIDGNTQDFDRAARAMHAGAVASISPQTLARLRVARHAAQAAPPVRHAWRWITATAFSAVLAVTLGVQLLPRMANVAEPAPMIAVAGNDDGYPDTLATLDESPDLYVWLASPEAEPLAME